MSNSGQVKSGQISAYLEGVVLCYVSYEQSSQVFKYQSEKEQNSNKTNQPNKKTSDKQLRVTVLFVITPTSFC